MQSGSSSAGASKAEIVKAVQDDELHFRASLGSTNCGMRFYNNLSNPRMTLNDVQGTLALVLLNLTPRSTRTGRLKLIHSVEPLLLLVPCK